MHDSVIVWEGMTAAEDWVTIDQTFPLPASAWKDVMRSAGKGFV